MAERKTRQNFMSDSIGILQNFSDTLTCLCFFAPLYLATIFFAIDVIFLSSITLIRQFSAVEGSVDTITWRSS
jgi:hypothetical protein